MKEIKGYKPLRRTLAYMRRMISGGKWKANTRIPTLKKISMSAKVSTSTVRKAVTILETERLLDNHGSLGFCVVPPNLAKLYKSNRPQYLIRSLSLNLDALSMTTKGGKTFGKYVILKEAKYFQILDVISGDLVKTTQDELKESIDHPIELSSLVSLSGEELKSERKKYFRQQQLRSIANVILKEKELFN